MKKILISTCRECPHKHPIVYIYGCTDYSQGRCDILGNKLISDLDKILPDCPLEDAI